MAGRGRDGAARMSVRLEMFAQDIFACFCCKEMHMTSALESHNRYLGWSTGMVSRVPYLHDAVLVIDNPVLLLWQSLLDHSRISRLVNFDQTIDKFAVDARVLKVKKKVGHIKDFPSSRPLAPVPSYG